MGLLLLMLGQDVRAEDLIVMRSHAKTICFAAYSMGRLQAEQICHRISWQHHVLTTPHLERGIASMRLCAASGARERYHRCNDGVRAKDATQVAASAVPGAERLSACLMSDLPRCSCLL